MTEPAAAPQPQPDPYPWREPRDGNVDTLAGLVCAVLLDFDGAVSVLKSLDSEQITTLAWCFARWFADSLAEDFDDPVAELQRLALVLAHGRGESA